VKAVENSECVSSEFFPPTQYVGIGKTFYTVYGRIKTG
jgi:hypothetical protein